MHLSINSSPIIGKIPNIANLVVHIIGIGGIGMSAIAEILHKNGIKVQGSDSKESENTRRLESLGIRCFIGHKEENINNADIVAYSTAVKFNNVEYQEALKQKKILMSRHQILREIIQNSWNICVSGMHGKTTTSSMIALIFEYYRKFAGLVRGAELSNLHIHKRDESIIGDDNNFIAIIGGVMQYNQSNVIAYDNFKWAIVEADESDDSFIKIPSTIAVVTNISPEHLEYHLTFDAIKEKFTEFLKNIPYYGFGVVCIDDEEVNKIAKNIDNKKIVTYSVKNEQADYFVKNIRVEKGNSINFDVYCNDGKFLSEFTINIFGDFNISNCLAAIAVANELGINLDIIKRAMFDFRTTKRRFEILGSYKDAIVVDDYGHHPRELKVVIKTAKDLSDFHDSKLTVVFQPHKYTRLQKLYDEFVNVLSDGQIDNLIVLPVYSSGESEILGVNSESLLRSLKEASIQDNFMVITENSTDSVKGILGGIKLNKNDIILFMGAGDLNRIGYELVGM